jgi:hypothetical protein
LAIWHHTLRSFSLFWYCKLFLYTALCIVLSLFDSNSFTDIGNPLGNSERIVIAKAILEFHKKTCIRFVPRTNQNDYVNIVSANG